MNSLRHGQAAFTNPSYTFERKTDIEMPQVESVQLKGITEQQKQWMPTYVVKHSDSWTVDPPQKPRKTCMAPLPRSSGYFSKQKRK